MFTGWWRNIQSQVCTELIGLSDFLSEPLSRCRHLSDQSDFLPIIRIKEQKKRSADRKKQGSSQQCQRSNRKCLQTDDQSELSDFLSGLLTSTVVSSKKGKKASLA